MARMRRKSIPEWLHTDTTDLPLPEDLPKPLWLENERISEAMDGIKSHPEISLLLKRLWQKDAYTYDHCHRVADLSQWLGQYAGLSNQERVEIYLVGLLHDIGKLMTPDDVLKKPGPLTHQEYDVMKLHPEHSESIISSMNDISYLSEPIRAHHERFDGRGYPDQKAGDKIHIFSRIIFVADTFDAMTTSRVYRRKLNIDMTYQELLDCSGTQFDPEVAKAFVSSHKKLREWLQSYKKAA